MSEVKTQTERQKKLPRGRPFQKGGPGGPGRSHKRAPSFSVDESLALIEDMEKAYKTAESPTDSPIVKAFRKLAHTNPMKFAADYTEANKAYVAAVEHRNATRPEAAGREMGAVGPKEVNVEEMAVNLLSEWEGQDE